MAATKGKGSAVSLTKAAIEDAIGAGRQSIWDTKVPGLGVRIVASGRASFVVRYRLGTGTQRSITLGAWPTLTVDQARQLARAKLADVAAGIDPAAAASARRAERTVADIGRHYCDTYAPHADLKPRTIADAKRVMQLRPTDTLPASMKKKLSEFGPGDVRALMAAYRDKSESVTEANRLWAALSKSWNIAIEEGWHPGPNPCSTVKKYAEDERYRYFSEDETGRLLDASDDYARRDPVWGPQGALAVRLLLLTGARLQNVLKARWAEFDLGQGLWDRKSSHTKQKKMHRLELDGPVLQLLRDARATDPHCEFLFPGRPKAGKPVKPRADLNRPWRQIIKAAGISDARPHDMRRTNASFIVSDGGSLELVGKVLGHTQPTTTARYARMFNSTQRKAVGNVGEKMVALQTRGRMAEATAS